ncbi:anti-sigma factor family protein [Thioclava pacifica]|uniref:Anti-sigma factor n=1 Tax=Thioclava pacifica DSM 10166 TaxID=1353537 RepID=A0A074JAV5_9RHOB|nr:anti-sigma factor [Thioclava pacifica]KEO52698.1 hypothetical protein TP2_07085 [Thioclava pacifica DSM 10166]
MSDEELLAYHAGALDAAARARVEARLAGDPEARARLADWAAQDAALTQAFGDPASEPVPERLSAVIAEARNTAAPSPAWTFGLSRIAAAVALLAVGAAGGWFAHGPAAPQPGTSLAQAATTAYRTYVTEVVHPVEVPASDAAHLTSWVSKRLGHPIHAPDFATLGFRLMGGRVLPGEPGTAAQFMYENDLGQRITLYVTQRAQGEDDTAFRFFDEGRESGFWWVDGPFGYALVGDISRDALRKIATAAYEQLI